MITLEDITKKAKLLAKEAKEEVLSKCDGRSLVDFCSYIEKYSIKIGEWIMEETQKDSNTLIGKVDNDGKKVKYEDRWLIHNGDICYYTLFKTETDAEKLRKEYIEETGGRCKCEIIKIKVRV